VRRAPGVLSKEEYACHVACARHQAKLAAAPLESGQGGEVTANMAVARRLGDPREVRGLPSVGGSTPDEAEPEAGPEAEPAAGPAAGPAAEPAAEFAADPRAERVAVLAADPDWTKLVVGRDICSDLLFVDQTEAEIIVAAMREVLCGENGELQNLTEDGHIRLCVLAKCVLAITCDQGLSQGSMLDVDEFCRVMFRGWNHPEAARWRMEKEVNFTWEPDTQADIRGWWFFTLPFDKAIHGQLLAAIGTKAKKRKKKKKKKKSGSMRK